MNNDTFERQLDLDHHGAHPIGAELVYEAVKMAVAARGGAEHVVGVIFHIDRGSTYTAERFTALCRRLEIRQSMSRVGSCFDNAAPDHHALLARLEKVTAAHPLGILAAPSETSPTGPRDQGRGDR